MKNKNIKTKFKNKLSLKKLSYTVKNYIKLRDKRLRKSLTSRIYEKKIKKLNLKLWTISEVNKRLWILFIFLFITSYFF